MNELPDPAADPREWRRRARSNLERAGLKTPNSYFEDLCFDHDLGRWLTLIGDAGEARYPGIGAAVTEEQHKEALAIANDVVLWAEKLILG